MFLKTEINRPIDLLPHVTGQTLPCRAGRGRELALRRAFLFQALSELGLPAPFLPIALLPLAQFSVEGAVLLAVRSGDEIGNADINADHRCSGRRCYGDHFIIREGEPPGAVPAIERDTAVDQAALLRLRIGQDLDMIVGKFDGDEEGMAFIERAHFQPIIKCGVS